MLVEYVRNASFERECINVWAVAAKPSENFKTAKYFSKPIVLLSSVRLTFSPRLGNRLFTVYLIVSIGIPVIRESREMFCIPTRSIASINLLRSVTIYTTMTYFLISVFVFVKKTILGEPKLDATRFSKGLARLPCSIH